MANQFSAKIRFDPIAWRAYDKDTNASLTVIDNDLTVTWRVSIRGVEIDSGFANTPPQARAKARRALAKYIAKRA